MSIRQRLLLLLALSCGASGWMPVRGQAPADALATVKDMRCRRQERAVVISFRIDGAITPEDRRDVESGLAVSFTHGIQVVRRRKLFFDRSIARTTVVTSATLDTLTKQYMLTRTIDGRTVATTTTDSAHVMEEWLTTVRDLVVSLPSGSPRGVLEARVSSEYRRNYLLFLFPWSLSAVGDAECR